MPLVLIILAATSNTSLAQGTLNLLGTGTPAVVDSGDARPVVLAVTVVSDVAGQVLGCSFYKSPANTGVHVVSLWDSTGKILASQAATGETASGKQTVMFSTPVAIAAKQTFVCGYYAPNGHWSFTGFVFTTPLDVAPLHIPVSGSAYLYGTLAAQLPTLGSRHNYWIDVVFAPASGSSSSTWISGARVSTAGSTASMTWNTAVASDSQVEYGPSTSYGSTTTLAAARVTAHSVAINTLSPGTTYHFRVRSRDSDGVLAAGLDNTFAIAAPVIVALSPSTATLSSSATQQFMATVSNAANPAVAWTATAGSINSSGLYTAPSVSSATSVTVTATSQTDPSKSAFSVLTVNPQVPVLSVSPASLSFSGQAGSASLTPASVSVTNTGAGSLTFTGVSDQSWLALSASSGTAPSTLQVSPSITALKAGNYTGHVTLTGGGVSKIVTVALTVTAPPVQHTVALSWKPSANTNVVSYRMYRSTIAGSSYAMLSSAIGGASYTDQSVQAATSYYYVVTAVDDQGRESPYSSEIRAVVP